MEKAKLIFQLHQKALIYGGIPMLIAILIFIFKPSSYISNGRRFTNYGKVMSIQILCFIAVLVSAFTPTQYYNIKISPGEIMSKGEHLVLFYGRDCGDCYEIASNLHKEFPVGKKNQSTILKTIDSREIYFDEYNIKSMPTAIYFVDGVDKIRLDGYASKSEIEDFAKEIKKYKSTIDTAENLQ